MDPLRWIILGVGLLVLAGIYLFGRWREQRRRELQAQGDGSSGPGKPDSSLTAGHQRRVIDDSDYPGDHPPAPNYDTPFIDEDALQGIDDLLKQEEQDNGTPQFDSTVSEKPSAGSSSSGYSQPSNEGEELDTGVGPQGPWWQEGAMESQRAQNKTAQQPQEPHQQPQQPQQPQEPAPLKLSPASQVEINAYRTGTVAQAEKVVVVFVGAREGERFEGADIAEALEAVRMVPGEHRIWHRRGRSELGRFTVFSTASMVEPGYLDPEETLPRLQTPGLAFFMQLPLPVDGEEALDAMLASAYHVSRHLGGVLLDSTRSTLTRQVAEHLREQLREHRRQLHIAMQKQ